MNVELTEDQKAFARRAVASGRLRSEEDAVAEGLRLWEERERVRLELISMIDEADAEFARGDFIAVNSPEDHQRLLDEIKHEGRKLSSTLATLAS